MRGVSCPVIYSVPGPGIMPGFTGDWRLGPLSGLCRLCLQGWNKPWPHFGLNNLKIWCGALFRLTPGHMAVPEKHASPPLILPWQFGCYRSNCMGINSQVPKIWGMLLKNGRHTIETRPFSTHRCCHGIFGGSRSNHLSVSRESQKLGDTRPRRLRLEAPGRF